MKFEEVFNKCVAFYENDGGGFFGYACSAELFTKEQALELFEEYHESELDIEKINIDHARFGITQTDDGVRHNWMNCKKGKGSKEIWWYES